jgi:C-terminal processing protease CtpA/Prc
MAQRKEQWRSHNFGFAKLEHLYGNVGYLKIDGFAYSSWARDKAVGVMHFFSDCDALIIDLRDNRGGYGSMIKLISSYFFEKATHLGSRYIRKDDFTEQGWTTDEVDGKKMSDVDLYVLTSSRTFSAAEGFAFNLKNLNRATIVGENTAGGGHTVESVSNSEFKITARIPDSRAIGKSFEGVGVEPHVKVSREEAFDMAYILALENLSQKAESSKKSALVWMAEYKKALLKPCAVESNTLKKLEGSYRSLDIQFEGGHLYVIWPDSQNRELLLAISDSTYIVDGDPDIRLCFKINKSGKPTSVDLIYSDGYHDEIPKGKK